MESLNKALMAIAIIFLIVLSALAGMELKSNKIKFEIETNGFYYDKNIGFKITEGMKMEDININQGEVDLYYFHIGVLGSFMTNLFKLIGNADEANKYRLSLGFPEHVEAFKRYQTEKGYTEKLVKMMEK